LHVSLALVLVDELVDFLEVHLLLTVLVVPAARDNILLVDVCSIRAEKNSGLSIKLAEVK
jgi:hypothetical protein